MTRVVQTVAFAIGLCAWAAAPAAAQPAPTPSAAERLAQPDYTIISLPASLPVAAHHSAVRITHRFAQTIEDAGGAGLFGIDSGAQVGLEYRFGLTDRADAGIHRTSDRTIEFFGRYGLTSQAPGMPLEIAAFASIEGTDNFGLSGDNPASFTPAVGAIATRIVGDRVSVSVEPIWVHHANLFEQATVADRDSFLVGVGARVRVRPSIYLTGEWAPRAAGYGEHRDHASFAIEKRLGGHVFQFNVSDSVATTIGQIARGDLGISGWHLGFNISRRF